MAATNNNLPSNPGNRTKTSTSLFSVADSQSLISQLQDAACVLRTIIRATRESSSPTKFAMQYILQPTFKNDFFVVCWALPALSCTPRILDAAPTVRSDASNWTYQGTRIAVTRTKVLNIASSSQLGFVDLEFNTRKLLEYAIRELPFVNDVHGCNARLEEAVKSELKHFMGFEGCVLTSIGYQFNLVAFPAMAAAAESCEETVFLMDSSSHNSMYMGAFIACAKTKGIIVRWRHNDVADLETKLQQIYGAENSAVSTVRKNVWVTILGFYSMLAAVPPLDAIITLKRKYGFYLFIDEAVSFLGLGRTGRGIVEFFQDKGASHIGMEDVDMMGCTYSKSLSSMGGFVLCRAPLTSYLEASNSAMQATEATVGGSVPTVSLIRTLQILKKPALISQRLEQLRLASSYFIDGLEARGYRISVMRGSSMVALFLDNVDRMLKFLKHARNIGLICTGAAFPAAPRGKPLIRLLLTSSHTLVDIDEILNKIDQVAKVVGVKKSKRPKSRPGRRVPPQQDLDSATPLNDAFFTVKSSDDIDASIFAICPEPIRSLDPRSAAIRASGISAFSKFNLGSQGARWTWGTFSAHLSLEKLLQSTFIPIISSSMPKIMALDPIETILFPDPRTGILSVISQNMECLTTRRVKRGERSLVLLPEASGVDVKEGVAAARPEKCVNVRWYSCLPGERGWRSGLQSILQHECGDSPGKVHLTLYIDTKY
ncbi:Pyridoxal phosphate-dependent transferase [Elaphomyces granulatus]